MRWAAAAGILLLAAQTAAAAPNWSALEAQPYEPPKPAPTFALPDPDGKVTRLEDLRGKVVLLFFWATWGPDCREELPPVNRLYEELRGRGLEVRLVSFREDAALVKRTAAERGYVAPVLIDRKGDVTGVGYGVFGPPTAYLIDRQGRLLARMVGARDWNTPAAKALLLEVLAQPSK